MCRTLKSLADELARQIIEQLGIARRIAGADVVDRLDDADAEQVAPQPIDIAAGKILVVGRSEPGGQLLAARGLLVGLNLAGERELPAASPGRCGRA